MAARDISIHALLAESDFGKITNVLIGLNFYPRSPCGERRDQGASNQQERQISIHALLAESDSRMYPVILGRGISIHALLAESDHPSLSGTAQHTYFYPRSPCGERQARRDSRQQPAGISIHALLAESDFGKIDTRRSIKIFLSTLSLRRATSNESGKDANNSNFYPRSPCGERQCAP